MRARIIVVSALSVALALAGCGKKDGLDKGQVVATVDGTDITVHELNAELKSTNIPQGADRKKVERAVLQQIVNRKILAGIARDQGLEKSQAFAIQKIRAEEMVLAQLLQQQLFNKLGAPSRTDTERYVSDHPEMFANRRIFGLDQIMFQPTSMELLKGLTPLKSLDQVQQYLSDRQVKFRRGPASLDSLSLNPDLVDKLVKLPAGEVFVAPAGKVVTANVVTQTRVEPFLGEQAVRYAMQLVQRQRIESAVKTQIEPLVKKARDKVEYQKGFEPDATPHGAPAKVAG